MMSDFKAKYHALHLMQRLVSGDAALYPKGRDAWSPRKPKIRTSDDILREKYEELAELMAVQKLEQKAVSTLQKMYVSPKRSERKSRRRKRRTDDERREDGRREDRGRGRSSGRTRDGGKARNDPMRGEDGLLEKDRINNQRPQSASSNSSFSSYSSVKSSASKSSVHSNSSRFSSASNSSKASSRSSASSNASRTSTRSNLSKSSTRSNSSKTVERHFVTIVEEEEDEEIVNQDEIKERQVVRYDEELAKEAEEEARLKKEASKRTRRVSFVLEAEEQSSEDDHDEGQASSDDTLKGEDRYVSGEEDQVSHKTYDNRKVADGRLEKERSDYQKSSNKDERAKYIEIEESILREILSPRSPRRMPKLSPRSEEKSPTRNRSTSPRRRHNVSPSRSWDLSSSLPLPPRPKRDISPCDNKLSTTDNPEIKKWLRHKNALTRRERKAELKKEKEKRLEAEAVEIQKMTKHEESMQLYDTWLQYKRKEQRKQRKAEKRAAKEEKKREEEERMKREEAFKEKQRLDTIAAFGEKLPTPRAQAKKRRKSKSKKNLDKNDGDVKQVGTENEKDRSFPSSNPFKGLTYDQWIKQKLEQEEAKKKRERKAKKSDPDLEEVIPSVAKERIQRATGGKGKRVDSGLKKDRDDLPECDRVEKEQQRQYSWKKDAETTKSPEQKSNDNRDTSRDGNAKVGGRPTPPKVGLQRPSTSRNRLSSRRDVSGFESRSEATRKLYERVFSPTSARPEPQGSESNDDHSECSAKLGKGRPASADRNNNGDGNVHDSVPKAVVKHEGSSRDSDSILDPDDLSVFMTEPIS